MLSLTSEFNFPLGHHLVKLPSNGSGSIGAQIDGILRKPNKTDASGIQHSLHRHRSAIGSKIASVPAYDEIAPRPTLSH